MINKFFIWLESIQPKWVSYGVFISVIAAAFTLLMILAVLVTITKGLILLPPFIYVWYIAIFKQPKQ